MPMGFCYCTATVRFVSRVMSAWSPTLILSSTVRSATRRLYFHPFGPVKVLHVSLPLVAELIYSALARLSCQRRLDRRFFVDYAEIGEIQQAARRIPEV